MVAKLWVDKYRTEEALIESELSLGPMLLGKMGSFDGLCKTEYNNKPMFITKIDYERKRLIVETSVDANHLPTFASLPYDKLKEGYYCEQHLKMENVDCLGASRATNLKAALAAGGSKSQRCSVEQANSQPNSRPNKQCKAQRAIRGNSGQLGHTRPAYGPCAGHSSAREVIAILYSLCTLSLRPTNNNPTNKFNQSKSASQLVTPFVLRHTLLLLPFL